VADGLSRKSLHMFDMMVKELELIEQFRDLSLVSELMPGGVRLGMLKLTSNIFVEIKNGQKDDLELMDRVCWLIRVKVWTSDWMRTSS
jgi:hypothetical protein